MNAFCTWTKLQTIASPLLTISFFIVSGSNFLKHANILHSLLFYVNFTLPFSLSYH